MAPFWLQGGQYSPILKWGHAALLYYCGRSNHNGKKMHSLSFDTLVVYNPKIYHAELFSNKLKPFAFEARNSGD